MSLRRARKPEMRKGKPSNPSLKILNKKRATSTLLIRNFRAVLSSALFNQKISLAQSFNCFI